MKVQNLKKDVQHELPSNVSKGKSGVNLQDNRSPQIAQTKFLSPAPLWGNAIQLNKSGHIADNRPLQKKDNTTGLPDQLKHGVENLSGHSLNDVKVHYNSSKPAQLQAHAFAQGNQIHIAPGQEKHLPHEAWHVAQQKQGRVRPTVQMKKGIAINDDKGLEHEADVMGANSAAYSSHLASSSSLQASNTNSDVLQGQFTPYSLADMGHGAAQPNFMDDIIGLVVYHRVNNMVYTYSDGDNTGSVKHHVPYNWIMKNLADHLQLMTRRDALEFMEEALNHLGLAHPGITPTDNRISYDTYMRDAAYSICDYEENLFRHSDSTGDGGGTRLDVPNLPATDELSERLEMAVDKLGILADHGI